MAYATYLFFDEATDAAIRSIWQVLADEGVAPKMLSAGIPPHLTLAAYQDLDVAQAERRIALLVEGMAPLDVTFAHLGVFVPPQQVVFAAPTVTKELLSLHAGAYNALASIGAQALPYYLPGETIPHCSLALEMPVAAIGRAVEVCLGLPLPFKGKIVGIGLAEYHPIKILSTYRFEERR